jgi:hypothetical protein
MAAAALETMSTRASCAPSQPKAIPGRVCVVAVPEVPKNRGPTEEQEEVAAVLAVATLPSPSLINSFSSVKTRRALPSDKVLLSELRA